ncbi:hypothetical protein D9758_011608 [Tetrapyrgos nigripes]|uniref:Uncharacterized protein n=1 Tax=Tetrapyrgos nigripes TaxID=182062 RepID=A0A8H5CQ23_9AGAR|nr:hypothetical protein D9758_011608 [Tetrapyrgos nigripes]
MNSSSTMAAPAPAPVELTARIPDPANAFPPSNLIGVSITVDNCRFAVADANGSDIWSFKTCVAAATCQGTSKLIDLVQCSISLNVPGNTGANVPEASQTNSLNYNIYAGIVGDCAWQQGGCPITQQNYIDFVYGTLSEINTDSWPDVNNVINNWWTSIKDWTATGETVPYLNFNDWLRFSDS